MKQRSHNGSAWVALALGAILALPAPGSAQETFTVSGRAMALDGSPLQNTVVGIPELETWALSDIDGRFELANVRAGQYRFAALKRGYYYADTYVNFTGPVALDIQLEPESADNPVPLGAISGTVFDQESGDAVRDAEVLLEPMNTTVSTNRRGQFEFQDLTIGALRITTSRLGYETRVDTLASLPEVTLDVRIHLKPDALDVAPIEVTVEARNQFLDRNGFYRRAQRGQGTQWGPEEIAEQIQTRNVIYTSQLFDMVPGVRRGRGDFGQAALQSTRDGCVLTPVVNGMRMPGFDLDSYQPNAIRAAEIYRGAQVPMEYSDPCGVVLLWTL